MFDFERRNGDRFWMGNVNGIAVDRKVYGIAVDRDCDSRRNPKTICLCLSAMCLIFPNEILVTILKKEGFFKENLLFFTTLTMSEKCFGSGSELPRWVIADQERPPL